MISVDDAFKKFRSRLELTDREQDDASRRHNEIRNYLKTKFDIERDFLTGSYKRWTKTKPLKDVDIFCVLGEKEHHRRDKPPADLLKAFEDALVEKYGRDKVSRQRRSVTVDFGVKPDAEEDTGGKVMSFDVVPAFAKNKHYEIPDTATSAGWTETNPEVHYDLAVEAQKNYDGAWKGIVRMTKKWNAFQGKPVKPSFLIEVMALELLDPPFGGDYRYEIKAFLASLADRIDETWDDPAKLGPPVSDSMDYAAREAAKVKLREGSNSAARAIQLEKQGKNGEALKVWRNDVFGPMFPLS
ncbi:MAG: DNA polymerase subunit beta [Planctomycetaceae bacterium]|nr:DNA polymerase subunit beta [Planctomycetaceae bacterium]